MVLNALACKLKKRLKAPLIKQTNMPAPHGPIIKKAMSELAVVAFAQQPQINKYQELSLIAD